MLKVPVSIIIILMFALNLWSFQNKNSDEIKGFISYNNFQKGYKLDSRNELSPLGLRIGEYYASDDNEYIFFSDSLIIFKTSVNNRKIGYWHMEGDFIVINYFKILGKRGIGEPMEPYGGANGPDEYKEYVTFVEYINEEEKLSWSELKGLLIENANYPYNVIEENVKIDLTKYDFELPGDYAFISERKITKEELSKYDLKELRIIRNEIFARYGYMFRSNDLKEYFLSKEWYTPLRENADKYLSDLEKSNIEILFEVESEKK